MRKSPQNLERQYLVLSVDTSLNTEWPRNHPNMPQNPSHPLHGQHPSNSPFEQVDGSHLSRGLMVENGVGVAGKKQILDQIPKNMPPTIGFFPLWNNRLSHESLKYFEKKKTWFLPTRTVQRYQKTIKQILSTQMKIDYIWFHELGKPFCAGLTPATGEKNTYVLSWCCLPNISSDSLILQFMAFYFGARFHHQPGEVVAVHLSTLNANPTYTRKAPMIRFLQLHLSASNISSEKRREFMRVSSNLCGRQFWDKLVAN